MNHETNETDATAAESSDAPNVAGGTLDATELAAVESLAQLFARAPTLTLLEVSAGESSSVRFRRRRPAAPSDVVDADETAPATTATANAPEVVNAAPVSGGTATTARDGGPSLPQSRVTEEPLLAAAVSVTALLVGVFRTAPASGKSAPSVPFVVGARVAERQILGRIEALGIFTDCIAPVSGTIAGVAVQEGQPVEYGQALFDIQPTGAPLSQEPTEP